MILSSYPLLDAFWTILEIVIFVLWIWLVISIFVDIFRSHDLSGFAKALWVLGIFVFPLVGVLIYLIAGVRCTNGRCGLPRHKTRW